MDTQSHNTERFVDLLKAYGAEYLIDVRSISGAAEYLHLTQPTLSRQLMDLEIKLGNKLYIQGGRKVTLTEDGLFLRKRANVIVELVEKTQSEFQDANQSISGDVYTGGGESDAMRLVAHTARALQSVHPHIHFHLFSGNAEDVGEQLEKGLLNFGILVEPRDLKRYSYIKLPLTDVWGVLMRKDSPLAAKGRIRPKDLWDQPLLLSQQAIGKDSLSNWFKRDYSTLNIITTYNLVFNASLMVDEGLGYAVGLDKLVNPSGTSSLCFRPLEPKLEVSLYMVWKKFQVFSRAAERFQTVLQEQQESMVSRETESSPDSYAQNA